MELEEAKKYLKESFYKKGSRCPCCNQTVKAYPRRIHKSMARALLKLYLLDKSESQFYHVHEFTSLGDGGDFAKIVYWDLIEEMKKDEDETNKRTSGYWRITDKGKQFVQGKIAIPRIAWVYNQTLLKFDGEEIKFHAAYGAGFNYEELFN